MSFIIFKKEDNSVGVVSPSARILNTLSHEEIAMQSVPSGLPFWIVSEDDMPEDVESRNAWEFDGTEGDPDGYGSDSYEFSQNQLDKINGVENDKDE